MNQKQISRKQLLQYGAIAAPVAFAGFPLYILAPDFYATQHGLSLTSLGVVLLCLRGFDAIQDPFIGQLSDKFSGKLLPAIMTCAAILVLSLYALFHPQTSYKLLWFTISMLLAVVAYSVITINLGSLGALWGNDRREQTHISSMREAFALVGLLLAVSLPSILGQYFPVTEIYYYVSIILALLMTASLLAFNTWFKAYSPPALSRKKEREFSLCKTIKSLPKKTHKLFLIYGLSVLASSIPAILVIFFVRDMLQAYEYIGTFLFLYFISGAAAMPLWRKLSEKYGKYQAWLFATILAATSICFAFFLGTGDVWQYGIICIISGMAFGADLSLPPSILADHIHEHDSQATAAVQFSILALLTKAGLAIGSAVVLPLLDFTGFKPDSINTDSAIIILSTAYAIIPSLLKLLAAYSLYRLFIFNQKEISYETYLENSSTRSIDHA